MGTACRVWVPAAFAALNALYLYWLWAHFPNWGFWDWDLQETLLEAARSSLLEHGQLPLWNPYMGGGVTLVGHPLGRTFNPSFLPILLFGTVAGVKIAIFLYLLLAQWGAYRLARSHDVGRAAACFAAVVFGLGGAHAQHLTHGHFEWLGYAWLPFALVALRKASRRWRARHVLAGSAFLALTFLDGGPYQLCFSLLLLALYAPLLAIAGRTLRPLAASGAIVALAGGLAAVQLVPVAETFFEHPRETVSDRNFYEAPFQPTAGQILFEGYVSREQGHDPARWMPFLVNVGCYVGLLPVALGLLALARAPGRCGPPAAVLALCLWIHLGPAAPLDAWALLHRLPGFASLQVPARLNVFVLLWLAVLAAIGLEQLRALLPAGRAAALVPGLLVALQALDQLSVNAPVFRVAFSVPPQPVAARAEFAHHRRSPFEQAYREAALYPVWDNWPNATFPTTLGNAGVIDCYGDLDFPRRAIAFDDPGYPGKEAWGASPGVRVEAVALTPNRVAVRTSGAGGRVVVNQNHQRGWRADGDGVSEVTSHAGLVSTVVAPGERTTVFRFAPASFRIGAAISLAALAVALGLAWRRSRVSPETPPPGR